MNRFQITAIITCLFTFAYGQGDSDFIPDLIQKENIDSCIVCADFGNYPQFYVFDEEGRISKKLIPTVYVASTDSVMEGKQEIRYYYDDQGRLVRKTSNDIFPRLNLSGEYLIEERVYDLEGRLINKLHYLSYMEKMTIYSYQDNLLISELTTNFNNPKGTRSTEIEIYKRLHQYDQDSNLTKWIGYNTKGTVMDSCTFETDSTNLIHYTNYFNLNQQPPRLEKQIIRYDQNWRTIEIRNISDDQVTSYDISRTKSGLITRITKKGEENYEFKYEYK